MRCIGLAVAALISLLAAPALAADFEGVIDMKFTSTGSQGAGQGKGKTWISPKGWRVEMQIAVDAMEGRPVRTVVLGKTNDAEKIYMLNEATKTYAAMNLEDMKGYVGGGEDKQYTVKKLGKDSIAGFSCQKALVTENPGASEMEVCVSRELPTGSFLSAQQASDAGWMTALKDAGVEGYPLRAVTRSKGNVQTTVEVTKVAKSKVPASMYEIPSGYTQTSVMGVMAQDPAQRQQMENAQEQLKKAMENMTPEQKKMMEQLMNKGTP